MTSHGFMKNDASRHHGRSTVQQVIIDRQLGARTVELDQYFRRIGYNVKIAEDEANARQIAGKAKAVVLGVEGTLESGFLTCKKMLAFRKNLRVVLVGPESDELERFAVYAGAVGYVTENTAVDVIAKMLIG